MALVWMYRHSNLVLVLLLADRILWAPTLQAVSNSENVSSKVTNLREYVARP
jgi:hypothetical protein